MEEIGLSAVLVLTVLIAGFLTLVEFSLLRLKRPKIKELIQAESHEDWLHFWIKRSERYWLTSLVLGTACRLTAAVTLFMLIDRRVDLSTWPLVLVSVAVSTVIVMTLTEIVPRAIGRAFCEKCARAVFLPIRILSVATWVLALPFIGVIRLMGRFLNVRESLSPVGEFEEDIMEILETSDKSTELEEDEKELISSVVEFTDTIAREVMVPRVDVVAVEKTATVRDVYLKIIETGHSRIPVYESTIDNILGVFYVKDLLKYLDRDDAGTRLVVDEMHEPIFVPETKNVNDLLQEFQQKKMNVAIVVDEYGGMAGLITMKDLLEEIVGEMQDEDDREEESYTTLKDGSYVVDAKMPIDEITDELGISLPESSEYETIGGYIYTTLGKIPHKDEVFQRDGVQIRVLEVDDRRIHKVMLRRVDLKGTEQ